MVITAWICTLLTINCLHTYETLEFCLFFFQIALRPCSNINLVVNLLGQISIKAVELSHMDMF